MNHWNLMHLFVFCLEIAMNEKKENLLLITESHCHFLSHKFPINKKICYWESLSPSFSHKFDFFTLPDRSMPENTISSSEKPSVPSEIIWQKVFWAGSPFERQGNHPSLIIYVGWKGNVTVTNGMTGSPLCTFFIKGSKNLFSVKESIRWKYKGSLSVLLLLCSCFSVLDNQIWDLYVYQQVSILYSCSMSVISVLG